MRGALYMLKFLEIMAHFSLRSFDLLEYQLRNTDRWLREHKLNDQFTDVLIKSFPSLQMTTQYVKLRDQLAAIDGSGESQALKSLVLEWMHINFLEPRKEHVSADRFALRSR